MVWFRKEKKPRQPLKARLEIPADVWEKCESCGHTDIREKFQQSFNVCPACAFHRRLRAIEYTALLLDEGSIEEIEPDLYAPTSKTFIGRIYSLFGLKNIADAADTTGSGYPKLSPEYVVSQSPDIVVLADIRCCGASPRSDGTSLVAGPTSSHQRMVTAPIPSRKGGTS